MIIEEVVCASDRTANDPGNKCLTDDDELQIREKSCSSAKREVTKEYILKPQLKSISERDRSR